MVRLSSPRANRAPLLLSANLNCPPYWHAVPVEDFDAGLIKRDFRTGVRNRLIEFLYDARDDERLDTFPSLCLKTLFDQEWKVSHPGFERRRQQVHGIKIASRSEDFYHPLVKLHFTWHLAFLHFQKAESQQLEPL